MATIRPKAVATRLQETDRVIVTEWRFAVGAETGWAPPRVRLRRRLPHGRQAPGRDDGGGCRDAPARGAGVARPVGVEHNIVNTSEGEFAFVEVELKVAARRPVGCRT